MTVDVTQTSVCSFIYVILWANTSEICVLLRFTFFFFLWYNADLWTCNHYVYPEYNIGAGNLVIFDIFMVAKYVELLTVWFVFSMFVCV
jgi:hypothetical protein